MLCLQIGWTLTNGKRQGFLWISKNPKKTTHKRTGGEAKIWTNLIVCQETGLSCNICCNLSATHSHSHNMERVPLPVLKQSFSTLQIMQAPLQSRSRGTGCSVYNSVQYYWWQIMINNNNIDKNGTLALTSDLICRPLCTIWCIEYHNHAWVHFWKEKCHDNVLTVHRRAYAELLFSWSYPEEAIDLPVNLFSCSSSAANPRRKAPPSPPPPPPPLHLGHCFPSLIWYPLKVLHRPHF